MIGTIQLDRLIDINVLQNIQDSFAKATGIAAITVDYQGRPITKESNFTKFCTIIRNDDNLKEICYQCDAYGGIQAAVSRKPYIYKCHAGLFDFAVPIIVQGSYVGAILCGQIRIENESNKNISDFGIKSYWGDNKELILEYNNTKIKKYKDIEAAGNLIYQISNYMVESEFINLIKEELNNKTTKLMEEANKRSELEKSLKEAELKSLYYQINPHFMFNALNTIVSLAHIENASKTEELIYNFSDMIRYTLSKDSSKMYKLEEELLYIKNYLNIQKTRFRERLRYTIDIDEKYYNIKCPFMILQPNIENFIKYVVEQKTDFGEVKIIGYEKEENFIIDIKDNGDGISENKINDILNGEEYKQNKNCIGIHNVNKRLMYTFGEEYGLKIYSENIKSQGTTIRITLPLNREVVYV